MMLFEQTGFTSAAMRDDHALGWDECFARLDRHLADLSEPDPMP
jgi:hypothetical protein